jgi:hypothetical protein
MVHATEIGITAERAVGWLQAPSATWSGADVPEAKADLLHAIYEEIVVTGRKIVSIRLTPAAHAHGLALALPTNVEPPFDRIRTRLYLLTMHPMLIYLRACR